MAKVLLTGIEKPDGPPPVGAQATCPRCAARGYSRVFIKQL
jgi:hypothetical protein